MDDPGWFRITEVEDGILLIEDPGHVQSYLIKGDDRAALVDTGMGFRDLRRAIEPWVSTPVFVLNSHWHFDHIGGNTLFSERGIADKEKHLVQRDIPNGLLMDLYIKPCLSEGIPLPSDFMPGDYRIRGAAPSFSVADGDAFNLGGRKITALATPGHTHGSMSFLDDLTGSLFTGDLVCEGPLYAHFWDSDTEEYIASLEFLLRRRAEYERLFVSHGTCMLPPGFLESVLEGFLDMKKGKVPAHPETGWGELVDRYEFGGFSILVKPFGSPGVKLFGWTS